MKLEQLLRRAIDCGASDIFVVAGLPLTLKVRGAQQRLGENGRLTAAGQPGSFIRHGSLARPLCSSGIIEQMPI